MSTRKPPPSRSGPSWWLIVSIALIGFGGLYLWQRDFAVDLPLPGARQPALLGQVPYDGPVLAQPVDPAVVEVAGAPSGPPVAQADEPMHPLPQGAPEPDEAVLGQAAARVDDTILAALVGLAPRGQWARFGNLGELTRRFVVTVDNLPREMVPAQYSAARRIPGAFSATGEDGRSVLRPRNFERYDGFVDFVETLGATRMVDVYLRFYPVLQKEYRQLGYPKGHFNDRVIEAIDDMLAAPEPSGPIVLEQPRVQFRFADPGLERLSAGQKIMIRIGPENAMRLKKVLREIRAALAG